ncbi:MAG: hypothetical protein ACI9N1_000179 [Flavobacteriales bacterium]|jgi:hypothetical protein
MDITAVELVGYAASIAVAVSFVMKDMFKLRLVNIVGCALFVAYGLMLPTIRIGLPVILTNVAIICVNLFYINQTRQNLKKAAESNS